MWFLILIAFIMIVLKIDEVTEEEIKSIVDEGSGAGILENQQRQ